MPETDVTKMKVADLKRELKLRGLVTTGNKTELQDRLQTALIDGDISLEDTAISGDDALLDEDAVLTDEEEDKILGADENELLKSPTATPVGMPDLTTPLNVKTSGIAMASSDEALISPTTPTSASKKIVLKRKNSFTTNSNGAAGQAANTAGAVPTAKENTEPTPTKTLKMSERNPISISSSSVTTDNKNETSKVASKVSQLTLQERLDMRAKKFGINASAPTTSEAISTTSSGETDQKQLDLLKKRAERFGCVISSKIVKLDAEEKLLKRKERFGGAESGSSGSGTSSATSDVWAEKARLRLERFKSTKSDATTTTTPAAPNAITTNDATSASATPSN